MPYVWCPEMKIFKELMYINLITLWPLEPYPSTRTPDHGAINFKILVARGFLSHHNHIHGLSEYCIQRNICPVLFSPSLSAGEFKTRQIPMFHFISRIQNCFWANLIRSKTVCKCWRAKITLKTVCVYIQMPI